MGLLPTALNAIAALFAVLAITYAVRSALVNRYVAPAVHQAATVWRDHPDVLATLSRLALAEAAAQNDPALLKRSGLFAELAKGAPLAPEPFLAAGALAVDEGRYAEAEQLLLAARTRNPRSAPTRYLLAELYWRENRVGLALQEMAAVRRLFPVVSEALIAGLAEYVRRVGPTPQIRAVLHRDEWLRSSLLSSLASDPQNAELIFSLAGARRGSEQSGWVQRLSGSLINAGEFRRAHKLWLQFASPEDLRAAQWEFVRSESSSPFTWQFTENSAGSAVPAGERLELFFSGRQSTTFASKLVLLPPGFYEISLLVSGTPPSSDSIRWSVTCLPAKQTVAEIPLMNSGGLSAQVRIPQNCSAQQFELKGAAQSFPETASFWISKLRVTRREGQ